MPEVCGLTAQCRFHGDGDSLCPHAVVVRGGVIVVGRFQGEEGIVKFLLGCLAFVVAREHSHHNVDEIKNGVSRT